MINIINFLQILFDLSMKKKRDIHMNFVAAWGFLSESFIYFITALYHFFFFFEDLPTKLMQFAKFGFGKIYSQCLTTYPYV